MYAPTTSLSRIFARVDRLIHPVRLIRPSVAEFWDKTSVSEAAPLTSCLDDSFRYYLFYAYLAPSILFTVGVHSRTVDLINCGHCHNVVSNLVFEPLKDRIRKVSGGAF
jgi:hypothetical protein